MSEISCTNECARDGKVAGGCPIDSLIDMVMWSEGHVWCCKQYRHHGFLAHILEATVKLLVVFCSIVAVPNNS